MSDPFSQFDAPDPFAQFDAPPVAVDFAGLSDEEKDAQVRARLSGLSAGKIFDKAAARSVDSLFAGLDSLLRKITPESKRAEFDKMQVDAVNRALASGGTKLSPAQEEKVRRLGSAGLTADLPVPEAKGFINKTAEIAGGALPTVAASLVAAPAAVLTAGMQGSGNEQMGSIAAGESQDIQDARGTIGFATNAAGALVPAGLASKIASPVLSRLASAGIGAVSQTGATAANELAQGRDVTGEQLGTAAVLGSIIGAAVGNSKPTTPVVHPEVPAPVAPVADVAPAAAVKPITVDPVVPEAPAGMKERKLMAGAIESPETAPETKGRLTTEPDRFYEPTSFKEIQDAANKRIEGEGGLDASLANYYGNKNPTPVDQAVAIELYRRYQAAGDFDKAHAVMTEASRRATSQGQAIAILKTLARSSPDGITAFAEKEAGRAIKPAERQPILDLQQKARDAMAKSDAAKEAGKLVDAEMWNDAALAHTARMYDKISLLNPRKTVDYATAGLNIALLSNPKTLTRNVVGNTILSGVQGAADAIAPTLDKGFSLFTGSRTVSGVNASTYWKTLLSQPGRDVKFAWAASEGAKPVAGSPFLGRVGEAMETLNAMARATASGKMELGDVTKVHRTVFQAPVAKQIEQTLGVSMGIPDRAFYKAKFHQELVSAMKADNVRAPSAEMVEQAHLSAMAAIFQDENRVSQFLKTTKNSLNKLIGVGPKTGQRFGLGNVLIPFTQVPGSIFKRSIQFSPFGVPVAMYKTAMALAGKGGQRVAVDELSKALVGTAGYATAYGLAQLGVLRGGKFDDEPVEQTYRREGIPPYSVNLSAMQRIAATGRFVKQENQPGDLIYTYDWAQPVAATLSMGADLQAYKESEKLAKATGTEQARPAWIAIPESLSLLKESAGSGAQTISELPVMTGLTGFFRGIGQGNNVVEQTMESLANLPAMYAAPPLVSQIQQLRDNIVRETRSTDAFESVYNRTVARIPIAAEAAGFKPKYNELGEIIERYPEGDNTWYNVFMNPGFIKRVKGDPVNRELLDVWQATGERGMFPREVDAKITVNDKPRLLTPQERSDYQQFVGRTTRDMYAMLVATEGFRKLPPDARAKVMSALVGDVNTVAKVQLFGHKPKTISKVGLALLGYTSINEMVQPEPPKGL